MDGILAPSTLAGVNVILFPAAADALPAQPSLSVSASDPALLALWDAIAKDLGYTRYNA